MNHPVGKEKPDAVSNYASSRSALIKELTDLQRALTGIRNEVLSAVEDLCEKLKILRDVVDEYRGDLSDRERAKCALGFVIEFLGQVCATSGVPAPLIKLQNALNDLDRGVVVPMFRTELGNKGDPSLHVRAKGAAAATMTLLMATGIKRKEAARQVSAQLRCAKMSFGDRRTSEDWQTVAAWRDHAVKAIKSKSEDDLLGESYKGWLSDVIVPPPTNEREYGQFRKGILKILLDATTRYNDKIQT
jgi:hypothetical protein